MLGCEVFCLAVWFVVLSFLTAVLDRRITYCQHATTVMKVGSAGRSLVMVVIRDVPITALSFFFSFSLITGVPCLKHCDHGCDDPVIIPSRP